MSPAALAGLAPWTRGAGAADGAAAALSIVIAALIGLSLLFAAVTLALRARSVRAAARWSRLDQAWRGPLLEVLAGDRAAVDLAGRVRARDRGLFADFLVGFARRLRGPEREAVGRLAAPFLGAVARRAGAGSADVRARRVLTLGLLQSEQYRRVLVAALDDRSDLVAMTAARALARPEHARYVGAILARLHRFRDWRPGFIASLLAAAGPATAPALRTLLTDRTKGVEGRIVAAETLRLLHDLPAAKPAAAIVAEGGPPDLVAAALRLLASVGSREQAAVVRGACASANPVLRAQACAALGGVGAAADADLLGSALEDPDPWVALHAARSLRVIGGPALLGTAAAGRAAAAAIVRQVLAE